MSSERYGIRDVKTNLGSDLQQHQQKNQREQDEDQVEQDGGIVAALHTTERGHGAPIERHAKVMIVGSCRSVCMGVRGGRLNSRRGMGAKV